VPSAQYPNRALTDLLEQYDVPIEEMIRAGEQLQRSRLDPTRAEDLPVYCIYRPPFLLALRWLSDDQKSVSGEFSLINVD
jgi:hypothetical protein